MSDFSKVIIGEIERIEAERREQQAQKAAANDRLQKARDQAKAVRDRIIIPLLNDLRDDFAAEKRRVLPRWVVQSDGKTDVFVGSATTPDSSAAGMPLPSFTIRAGASLAEAGASLEFSVTCSFDDPEKSAGAHKRTPLHEAKDSVPMPAFDESRSRQWFREQIAECVRKCVREKIVPRPQFAA